MNGPRWTPSPRIPVAIVIPVHNAPRELTACLEALVRNTTYPATVVLVDDASTDPEVETVLAQAGRLRHVQILRNSVNHGFSASVNRGLRATPGQDVVVLNSDTAVTPQWLERLVATAHSDPLIATATPVSDNAGAFSVPAIGVSHPLPPRLGPHPPHPGWTPTPPAEFSVRAQASCGHARRPATASACSSNAR
jgi:GT2 family glycosyltransferase